MNSIRVDRATDLVIVGIALRSSPSSAAADISAFWQRFMREDIAATLGPKDGHIYAVYTDYESDWRGPYTMVLGVAGEASASVPAGMRRVRAPAGEYASFAARGNPAEVIWKSRFYSAILTQTKRALRRSRVRDRRPTPSCPPRIDGWCRSRRDVADRIRAELDASRR